MSGRSVVTMTPFVFEDGKIYYFEIKSRSGNDYHDLFCYTKVRKSIFYFFKYDKFKQIGNSELVDSNLNKNNIEYKLSILIKAHTVNAIPGWDGFVGKVPEDIKKSILRNAKLGDILD